MTITSISYNTYLSRRENTNNNLTIPNKKASNQANFALDKSEALSQILGYGVDKEGYFTSDFNEAVGLPQDYKIHSLSIENFLSYQNSTSFLRLDLEKSLQNAYKLFSQLIDETKKSFSKEDLNAISQAFDFDKNSLQITQKYHFSESEYKNFLQGEFADYVPSGNIISTTSFFSFDDKPLSENLFTYTPFNANESVYMQDESVSKGGLFVAFLGNQKLNYYVAEGQTNLFGKLQGLDKTMEEAEVYELRSFVAEYNQYFDISELYFNVLRSNLSVEEFKELAISKKEVFLKQNKSLAVNFSSDMTKNNTSKTEDKKTFTPIEVKSRQTYKNLNSVENIELIKTKQIKVMLEILFNQKAKNNFTLKDLFSTQTRKINIEA